MRQTHAGGDNQFVDYAGDPVPVVIDRLAGEIREAWIFIAVLGAPRFTYAEATWTLGRLRNQRYYSLAELNEAIGALLVRLNDQRPIRRLGVTRHQLLEELDRPALKPLPVEPYVFAEWRLRRVGIDYHVEINRHY